ncbi:MAG: LysR family transcriptional regulator [Eubacteriaceae bacterium]|nr:LysR family transcriptional regulator [Eubacteriaceae bacterium]
MEIRTLRYFLAVAREENMTRAAEQLHVTQPTLSKALKQLENELGKKLFIRHSFNIELTDEGMLLRKRAADLIDMADKIHSEFHTDDDITGGNVYFGLAESYQIRHLARIIKSFLAAYPGFRYHITSGDTEQVTEKLDKGILDFAVLVEAPDSRKYDSVKLPEEDRWGLIMPTDDPLTQKDAVTYDDISGLPLYASEQSIKNDFPRWCGDARVRALNFVGTFRLAYNGSIFTKEGLGYLMTLEHLVGTGEDAGLTFRPLKPELTNPVYVIWKKNAVLTPIAERFLETLKAEI